MDGGLFDMHLRVFKVQNGFINNGTPVLLSLQRGISD